MQAPAGSWSFDDQIPPYSGESDPTTSKILSMLSDGLAGVEAGQKNGNPSRPGFVAYLNGEQDTMWSRCSGEIQYGDIWKAARRYNSGCVDATGDVNVVGGQYNPYVVDIANRLIGWNGWNRGNCGS
jgi:hypothetical protein